MKKIILGLLSAALIFSVISCGSKPAPEEETVPEAPEVIEEIEEVEEAVEETVEEIEAVDNTFALASADSARNKALESGADKAEPDLFKSIDSLYNKIKQKADNGEDVSADCADLAKRYEALRQYISAKEAKEKVDQTNLGNLSQKLYDEGLAALNKTEELFADPSATGAELLNEATTASVSFNSVLAVVYKQLAKDARTAAFEAKKSADSVKAGVAQKEKYAEGVKLFKKGDADYSTQRPDLAYEDYNASKDIFLALYNDIAEKRAAAQAAIEAAKKRVAESQSYAEQADAEAPISEKIAGIEDEDTVLLEEDNYADPEEAEAELDATLEEASLVDQAKGAANNLLNAVEDAK